MKHNIKIMKTKPEITDEEIQGYMNFEGLIKELKSKRKKPNVSKPTKIISLVGGIAIIAFISFYIGKNNQVKSGESMLPKPGSEIPSSSPLGNSLADVQKDSVDQMVQREKTANPQGELIKPVDTKKTLRSTNAEEAKPVTSRRDSANAVPTNGYLQAEPVEGFPHLYEYFSSELKYPEEAVNDSIQGVVTVSFIVTKEGKFENIKVLNSLGQVFDKEVIRLIENMPAWKPATLDNKPVPSKISMPLTFRLERIKK